MHLILSHSRPEDFVVATGQTHSVRELVMLVFKILDLRMEDYVVQNPKFLRPEELPYLRGDATKAKSTLGWEPVVTFEELMEEMVDHWMRNLSGSLR